MTSENNSRKPAFGTTTLMLEAHLSALRLAKLGILWPLTGRDRTYRHFVRRVSIP
jgi:hypothetical protein